MQIDKLAVMRSQRGKHSIWNSLKDISNKNYIWRTEYRLRIATEVTAGNKAVLTEYEHAGASQMAPGKQQQLSSHNLISGVTQFLFWETKGPLTFSTLQNL